MMAQSSYQPLHQRPPRSGSALPLVPLVAPEHVTPPVSIGSQSVSSHIWSAPTEATGLVLHTERGVVSVPNG